MWLHSREVVGSEIGQLIERKKIFLLAFGRTIKVNRVAKDFVEFNQLLLNLKGDLRWIIDRIVVNLQPRLPLSFLEILNCKFPTDNNFTTALLKKIISIQFIINHIIPTLFLDVISSSHVQNNLFDFPHEKKSRQIYLIKSRNSPRHNVHSVHVHFFSLHSLSSPLCSYDSRIFINYSLEISHFFVSI